MTPSSSSDPGCGCKSETRAGIDYGVLCPRHWNQMEIRYQLDRCLQWKGGRRLDPEDRYDRCVTRYLDQVAFWAAKAATEADGHA